VLLVAKSVFPEVWVSRPGVLLIGLFAMTVPPWTLNCPPRVPFPASVAPLATVTVPEPVLPVLVNWMVPAVREVPPVYVLKPDRRMTPVPVLVSDPKPLTEAGTDRSGLPDELDTPLATLNVTFPPPNVNCTPRGDVMLEVAVPVPFTVTVEPS